MSRHQCLVSALSDNRQISLVLYYVTHLRLFMFLKQSLYYNPRMMKGPRKVQGSRSCRDSHLTSTRFSGKNISLQSKYLQREIFCSFTVSFASSCQTDQFRTHLIVTRRTHSAVIPGIVAETQLRVADDGRPRTWLFGLGTKLGVWFSHNGVRTGFVSEKWSYISELGL